MLAPTFLLINFCSLMCKIISFLLHVTITGDIISRLRSENGEGLREDFGGVWLRERPGHRHDKAIHWHSSGRTGRFLAYQGRIY